MRRAFALAHRLLAAPHSLPFHPRHPFAPDRVTEPADCTAHWSRGCRLALKVPPAYLNPSESFPTKTQGTIRTLHCCVARFSVSA